MDYKIYDCSNSIERPKTRDFGGPVVNDIMRYLHENSASYNCEFVDDLNNADIVITNDVFPANVLETGLPLVKRMCSPFWHKDFLYRNESLNRAAQLADKVIFITEYSKSQYEYLYGNDLKNTCVITHWVDPKVFDNARLVKDNPNVRFTFAACATNWSRKEKRLSEIVKFANMYPDVRIIMIGTNDTKVPDNIMKIGYIPNPELMSVFLNIAHGFINLSYRDAATKTVPQAISCGLPVLYANSGGVDELAGQYGIPIKDDTSLDVFDYIPELKEEDIAEGYEQFKKNSSDIQENLEAFDSIAAFQKMLNGYFSVIISVVEN